MSTNAAIALFLILSPTTNNLPPGSIVLPHYRTITVSEPVWFEVPGVRLLRGGTNYMEEANGVSNCIVSCVVSGYLATNSVLMSTPTIVTNGKTRWTAIPRYVVPPPLPEVPNQFNRQ